MALRRSLTEPGSINLHLFYEFVFDRGSPEVILYRAGGVPFVEWLGLGCACWKLISSRLSCF